MSATCVSLQFEHEEKLLELGIEKAKLELAELNCLPKPLKTKTTMSQTAGKQI
jgi:hypothetical protein